MTRKEQLITEKLVSEKSNFGNCLQHTANFYYFRKKGFLKKENLNLKDKGCNGQVEWVIK